MYSPNSWAVGNPITISKLNNLETQYSCVFDSSEKTFAGHVNFDDGLTATKVMAGGVDLGADAMNVFGDGEVMTVQAGSMSDGQSMFIMNVPTSTGAVTAFRASGSTTASLRTRVQQNGNGDAVADLVVLGTGDPKVIFEVSGGSTWGVGVDNSDSDCLMFGVGQAVGDTPAVRIGTDLAVRLYGAVRMSAFSSGVLTADSSGNLSSAASVSITTGTVSILGAEGGAATLRLWADEGDDANDKASWRITDGGSALIGEVAGSDTFSIGSTSSTTVVGVLGRTLGTGNVEGPIFFIGRNQSGGGAAGALSMTERNATANYLWVEAGLLRIGSAAPQEDNNPSHTGGTVVGAQTSLRSSKRILGEFIDTAGALSLLVGTRLWDFEYLDDRYGVGEQFMGITLGDGPEDAPLFGMDSGRAFSPVTAHGYTVAAIQELAKRLSAVEARVM